MLIEAGRTATRFRPLPLLLKAADDPDRPGPLRRAGGTRVEVVELDDLSGLIQRVVAPRNDRGYGGGRSVRCVRRASACPIARPVPRNSRRPCPRHRCRQKQRAGNAQRRWAEPRRCRRSGAAKEAKNPELQDTASRLLGEWMTVDAAPVLLDLAKSNVDDKYKVRALRGCIAHPAAVRHAGSAASRDVSCRAAGGPTR